MAKFCSECGESTTELMRRCPRCGATLMTSSSGGVMVRATLMAIGVLIMLSTFLGWYNIRLSIDNGFLDAVCAPISRTLFSYSGISTTYGLLAFGFALALIVFTACHRRYLTALAALGCVVVGFLAVTSLPEVSELMKPANPGGGYLMENFEGPLQGALPLGGLELIGEVITDYLSVGLLQGAKIMLMLSVGALFLSVYDYVRSLMNMK